MKTKKGNTHLLNQYDKCKRCRNMYDFSVFTPFEQYKTTDEIKCLKVNKYFTKADLNKLPVFCDG